MLRWPLELYRIEIGNSAFGAQRSYGLHSGLDVNVDGTWGNQDCGTQLFPIWPCEVTHVSDAQTGYGLILVYEIKGPWGARWVRYCHLEAILQAYGEHNQNIPLCLLGTTGNSTACHLHWDIFKKKPTNWRKYARNQSDLDTYFENPVEFMNQWKDAIIDTPVDKKFAKVLADFRSQDEDYIKEGIADGITTEGDANVVVGKLNDYSKFKVDKANCDEEVKKTKSFINRTANDFNLPKPEDENGDAREFNLTDIEKEIKKLMVTEDRFHQLFDEWSHLVPTIRKLQNYESQLESIQIFVRDYLMLPSLKKRLDDLLEKNKKLEKENEALRKRKPTSVFRIGKWLIWFVKVGQGGGE